MADDPGLSAVGALGPPTALVPSDPSQAARIFPTLNEDEIRRVAAHGRTRETQVGETLVEVGDDKAPFFVVLKGRLRVVRPWAGGETLLATHAPGQFSGEGSLLSGRPALARIQVAEAGEVIELDRKQVLALVQTDAELSEVLMRAFILRRVELIAGGLGDLVVIGSVHCAGTLRVREFLTRNGHPFHYIDLDRDTDAQELLDRFQVTEADVPVLIWRGQEVLRDPSNREMADRLGFNSAIDRTRTRDLVIVGAGPAGLAAAVYGASEGLDVLVLESDSPGGQAGSSSRIENYLGFPTGISGLDLTGRAYAQAQKFGAEIMIAKGATKLVGGRQPYAIEVMGEPSITTKAIVIATGAEYRKLPIDDLSRFEGAGVYYLATHMESQLCHGDEVMVVGGGNSAGQAAVFLAQTARRVHLLVRRDDLSETMSRYLVRRIASNPAITLRTKAEVVGLEGRSLLERVRWRDGRTGQVETTDVRHLFVMTGALPNTRWLAGCVALDGKGFVKTGVDLSPEDLATYGWPLARPPLLLETSRPSIFAVGDVRCGNVKRVASAVGEGSIAIALVHQALRQ